MGSNLGVINPSVGICDDLQEGNPLACDVPAKAPRREVQLLSPLRIRPSNSTEIYFDASESRRGKMMCTFEQTVSGQL